MAGSDPTLRDLLTLATRALSVPIGFVGDATTVRANVGLLPKTSGALLSQAMSASDAFGIDDPSKLAGGLQFLVAAPLVRDGRAFGAIVLADSRPRSLRSDDLDAARAAARAISASSPEGSEVHRMKSQFVSVVSHELRTPLTSIRGALGLLESGVVVPLPEDGLNLVRIARNNAERLIRLVNDILDIDKMEAGKLELHRRDVGARSLVEHALDALRPLAGESGVTLVSDVDPELRLMVDEDRVVQLLTNLVSNAIKFSPEKGTIRVRFVRRGPRTGRLTVRDEGPGIAPEQVPLLFGKFQQLDSSDRRARGGSGLGLAISKAIAEQHGGAIGVESTPGLGATFYADLPAVAVSSGSAVVLGPRRMVLIVDATGNVARRCTEALAKDGFITARAKDLVEAERWLDNARPAKLLVDVDTAEGRAVDLVHQLEGRFGAADVPRVILVGAADRPYAPVPIEWVVDPLDEQRMKQALRFRRPDDAPLRARIVEPDEALRAVLAAELANLGVSSVDAGHAFDLLVAPVDFFESESSTELRRAAPPSTPLLVYAQHDLAPAERASLARGLGRWLQGARVSESESSDRIRALFDGVLPRV